MRHPDPERRPHRVPVYFTRGQYTWLRKQTGGMSAAIRALVDKARGKDCEK